ncbi:MAG: M48 family metalloprotease [Xanthomonadales bacterium]|nr:M48 family metalloprotease [Xanthomonadales bacterium]NIN59375.1 M48 family metalloprotease [Xanthomonadales bacterium]NIN74726.1 M48 family metalloprotease [Xanthomonadales bacterium]NIO14862.1 M48 family metalloprotease [Xanthomonadales bacterium]NIP11768.1 M48 family metalloprotease [Xanthomonadales bacterium]
MSHKPARQRRWPRWLLAALVAAVACSAAAQSGRVPLPDMGNSAENVISEREESDYAKALVRQMRAYEVLVEDPQISDFFSDMGYRLVANSDRPDKAFIFVVLDEPNVNAFAAPGGVIALHSGLILSAETEHEVAGVLAHEVAHITQLHLYRAFEKAQRMSIPLALVMLGMILASGGDSDAITGAVMGTNAMAQQMQINFTRENEKEADRIGIQTLWQAGYDPQGMASFFAKLNRLTRANGEGPPEFLRTHPVTVNRIAEAEDRAMSMPRPATADGVDFYLMQARLRALLEDEPEDAITHFRNRQEVIQSPPQAEANRFGMAIALQREGEFEAAAELLAGLLERDPGRLAYQLQSANLDLERGRADLALYRLAGLYHNFPGNHAIAMQYSEALIRGNNAQQAETASVILRQQILLRGEDPALYALYARAANIAGDHVRAAEAIAESYYQRGGIREAMQQLEMLSRKPDLDYYQRSRVTARLLELRIQMGQLAEQRQSS